MMPTLLQSSWATDLVGVRPTWLHTNIQQTFAKLSTYFAKYLSCAEPSTEH